MANDAIEFYRQIVLKHIEEVKDTISDTKYRVYIAIVNECTDLETLKNMADFGMQDEFIAYSKGIDKRLGEYNTTVKELQEVCEGGYEITNLDEIKREELRKKREVTQAEVTDTIDKVLHSYDEYGDTIEALSKLEQIDDDSEYGIEVHMELNVDDFDDEEITEEDIERENETYEDEIEDIEELDEDDTEEQFSEEDTEDSIDDEELEEDSIEDEIETEELEEEDEDNLGDTIEDDNGSMEDAEDLEDDDEENGEAVGEYWYYDDGEYYDDYDDEEYKEDPKTVEELYDEIGNDIEDDEESSLGGEESSLFDFEDEDDTDDSDDEYPDEEYEDDTNDEDEDYFDELEDSDSIEEYDSINMDENEDYVGISETLEFEDATQEEPEEYLDDDQYEVDEEEDGEEDEEYLEDESESEMEENGMEFENDTDDWEDAYEDQFDFEDDTSKGSEASSNTSRVYGGSEKKSAEQEKPKQARKGEVFGTSTAHGKQAQDTLTAMTKMFNTAGKHGKKVNNYFENGRNTMKRKMMASGKRKDGKPSMFNLSDNIDLD